MSNNQNKDQRRKEFEQSLIEGLQNIIEKADNTPETNYILQASSDVLKALKTSDKVPLSGLESIPENEETAEPSPVKTINTINDIILIYASDDVPNGYSLLTTTIGGQDANLNLYGKDKPLYIAYSRTADKNVPVTNLTVTYPSLGEENPPGFVKINLYDTDEPAVTNLNKKGNTLNICMARDGRLPAISDIIIVSLANGEKIPDGYICVSDTPLGLSANLYSGKKDTDAFICFKRDYSMLDTLVHTQPIEEVEASSPLPSTLNVSLSNYTSIHATTASSYKSNKIQEQSNQLKVLKPLLLSVLSNNIDLMKIALYSFQVLVAKNYFYTNENINPLMELCIPIFCRSCIPLLPYVHLELKELIRALLANNMRSTFALQSIWETLIDSYLFFVEQEAIFSKQCDPETCIYVSANKNISWKKQLTNAETNTKNSLADILDANDILGSRINPPATSAGILDDVSFMASIIDQSTSQAMMASTLSKAFTYLALISPFNRRALITNVSPLLSSLSLDPDTQNLMVPLLFTIQDARLPVKNNKRNVLRRIVALDVLNHHLSLDDPFQDHELSIEFIRSVVFPTVLINFRGDTITHKEIFERVLKVVHTLRDRFSNDIPYRTGVIWTEIIEKLLTSEYVDLSYKLMVLKEYEGIFSNPELLAFFFRTFDNNPQSYHSVIKSSCKNISDLLFPPNKPAKEILEDPAKYDHIYSTLKCFAGIASSLASLSYKANTHNSESKPRSNSSYTEIKIVDQRDEQRFKEISKTFKTDVAFQVGRDSVKHTAANKRQNVEIFTNDHIEEALTLAKNKEDLTKGIRYLEGLHILEHVPADIAQFIWKYKEQIDPRHIGDYIGKEGNIGEENFYKSIRHTYIRGLDFTGLDLVSAMRTLLTKGSFFLPGEGQKIDRIIDTFSACYYEDNPGAFSSVDIVYVIAFSIVMCNTDLHNKKLKTHISQDGYVKLVTTDPKCKDIDEDMLKSFYTSIKDEEIIIPGMTIPGADKDKNANIPTVSNEVLLLEMMDNNVNASLALIRNKRVIAPHIDDLMDMVTLMMSTIAGEIVRVVDLVVDYETTPDLLNLCIDITRDFYITSMNTGFDIYIAELLSILSSIYWSAFHLNNTEFMPTHIEALSKQEENSQIWFSNCNKVISNLKQLVQSANQINDYAPYKKFDNVDVMIRSKIIEQDIMTKISSKGKKLTYTFYLFNNCFVYSKNQVFSTKQKIHLTIPLTHLEVSEIDNGFHIQSLVKSFDVLCSDELKTKWIKLITTTKEQLCTGFAQF